MIKKVIAFIAVASIIFAMFYNYLSSFTSATFEYKNGMRYSCFINDGMKPYTAFCVEKKFGSDVGLWIGQLYVLDLRTGAITKPKSRWSLSQYFE